MSTDSNRNRNREEGKAVWKMDLRVKVMGMEDEAKKEV